MTSEQKPPINFSLKPRVLQLKCIVVDTWDVDNEAGRHEAVFYNDKMKRRIGVCTSDGQYELGEERGVVKHLEYFSADENATCEELWSLNSIFSRFLPLSSDPNDFFGRDRGVRISYEQFEKSRRPRTLSETVTYIPGELEIRGVEEGK
jgi:hypothetical protein